MAQEATVRPDMREEVKLYSLYANHRCRLELKIEEFGETLIISLSGPEYLNDYSFYSNRNGSFKNAVLFLRPLSSMTEPEIKTVAELENIGPEEVVAYLNHNGFIGNLKIKTATFLYGACLDFKDLRFWKMARYLEGGKD